MPIDDLILSLLKTYHHDPAYAGMSDGALQHQLWLDLPPNVRMLIRKPRAVRNGLLSSWCRSLERSELLWAVCRCLEDMGRAVRMGNGDGRCPRCGPHVDWHRITGLPRGRIMRGLVKKLFGVDL